MSHDLDPLTAPAYSVKEGNGWLAVFNPDVARQMDVQLLQRYGHNGVICSVRFSSDGTLLAVGTDNAVVLYKLNKGEKLTFPLGPEEEAGGPRKANHARSVLISPDNKLLVAGSEDKYVRIWSIETCSFLRILAGHRGEVYALAFTSDSQTLLSASGDRTVRVWDATQFTTEAAAMPEPSCRVLRPTDPEERSSSKLVFTCLTTDSSSSFVAAGSLDGTIRVWDIRSEPAKEEPLGVLRGHADGVYGVQFLPHDTTNSAMILVSASLDRTLKRWEILVDEKRFTCKKTLSGHKDYVLAVSALQVGREQRVASSSRDGTVRLWDMKTGVPYFMIQGHTNTVTSVDLSSDGSLLASGSGDREVRLWKYTLQ
ncbi:WD40-repeat-containing domain protein [Phlebopus sp. FC_14]|nr:WD40-repeat-containing domain protein [Phlebopus sp. FC_14]